VGILRALRLSRAIETRRDVPAEPRRAGATFTLSAPSEITGIAASSLIPARIGRAEAMSVPAVKRCRDLIAGTVGSLPVWVRNGAREIVPSPLLDQPEPDVARPVTMTRTCEDLLLEGVSWWRVLEFGWHGYPTKVRRLEPRTVQVRQNSKVYVARDGTPQGQAWEAVPDDQLIRIDSPNDPLLVSGARAIRAALKLDMQAARLADNPAPAGVFTPVEGVDPGSSEEIAEMLDEWNAARGDSAWGYVGAALKLNPLSWTPEQLQLADSRQHAVLEIARCAGIDPEDLGVSTTSRTYQNAETRRLDLLDFTLGAYVSALQERLSMNDVLPRGHFARIQFGGFLRSDTKTRMETYEIGLRVGAYDAARIAELEDIPTATPAIAPKPAPVPVEQKADMPAAAFNADPIQFDTVETAASFRVNVEKRTVSGLAVPWGKVAKSGFSKWKFAAGSLHWVDEGRVKLNRDHDASQATGRAVRLQSVAGGLDVSFRVARGADGDKALALAEDGVLDGFSIEVDFEDGDEWVPDPTDESVRLVKRAKLRGVALTAMPAYDDARVASVAASRTMEGSSMTATAVEPTAAPAVPPDLTAFTAGLTEAIGTAVAEAFARLPEPTGRQVIPAGRAAVTYEPPVYNLVQGQGAPSFVRDAWKARTENDEDAIGRLRKFQAQQADIAGRVNAMGLQFATGSTSNLAEAIPPGYRPDLFVPQLLQGRPLVDAVSKGALSDATPFTLPRFVSATDMAADHVEGTNPSDGALDLETVTVTPGAVSGLFKLTREIVDSSNPAVDAIALQAMREAYGQNTEAKVYAELNGANGQGGTITAGRVPSGAYVDVDSGQGDELLDAIRAQLAKFPFHRFAGVNRIRLSQEATTALAAAKDSTGRPLLPPLAPQNATGTTDGLGTASQGFNVDGLAGVPAWSMTGNAAGDADVIIFNSVDVWAWESPSMTFRYEERSGPALIELALFGYFACRILRPSGIHAVRHTAA